MIAQQRKMYIMDTLSKKGIVNIKDVAQDLGVSEITVRRDFEKLENDGKLKRVQGGAALEETLGSAELTMRKKLNLNSHNKLLVAQYAEKMVADGDCVFIDGGTTMLPLLELLVKRPIKLVTYNAMVVRKMTNPAAEIFVVGGKYLPYYSMFVGVDAQDVLSRYNFDSAFLGCIGVNLGSGACYTSEMESQQMKMIGIKNSRKRYLMVDDSKINQLGFLQFASLEVFDKVICNQSAALRADGVPKNFTLV